MEEHLIYYYLLPVTAFFMTKKVKVIWTPWSDVYSYILETWNIWWRKGHSCTKRRGTELIDLTLCCSQGKASCPADVVSHEATAMPHILKLKASAYLSSQCFSLYLFGIVPFAYSLTDWVLKCTYLANPFSGLHSKYLEERGYFQMSKESFENKRNVDCGVSMTWVPTPPSHFYCLGPLSPQSQNGN